MPDPVNRMKPERQPGGDAFNHLWTDDERPCWDCGEPSRWVELAFETPLHPGPCTDRKYRELEEADRRAAEEQARREAGIPRGTRKDEYGTTFEWTGTAWRLVPRSELENEKWRQR